MLTVSRQPDIASAAAEAGEHLNKLLLENKKQPVLLMLSGGSALVILEYVSPSSLGAELTISVLDERFSQDPTINNFSQLQKTDFYKDALEVDASFFGTLPRNEDTMETLAARWEKNLRTWKEENPTGIIIATLGMGPDGHTAGIFPFANNSAKFEELFTGKTWLMPYDAAGKHQFTKRITTTLTFFNQINIGVAFVCGKEKQPALERIIKNKGQVYEQPSLIWQKIPQIKIFTDIAE